MKPEPLKYNRRSNRFNGYDYSLPGAYFITMVSYHRECLFGEVLDGDMRVNQYGKIVENTLMDLPNHYPQISIDPFVIMPNHVHTIIVIHEGKNDCRGGSQTRPYESNQFIIDAEAKRYDLPEIVRAFKSFSARRINHFRNTQGKAVWQRSYYDHIIRSDQDFQSIFKYIQINPQTWEKDQY